MTNANPIISLRNNAIIWLSITVFALFGTWWMYGFLSDAGSKTLNKVETLNQTLTLIRDEGVISEKNWSDLSAEEKKNERWSTMTRLVPTLQKLVGAGTPAAGKNINTMKTMSQKVGDGTYISWLEKSWTGEAATELTQTQADIAEIIPVFAGISEASSTESIGGKITLKSLVEYIQSNIVDQYGLSNVLGQIGIDTVKFLPESGDIGIYEVPLQFEKVPNESVVNLLQFIGKTGGVRVTETGKNITIEHLLSRPIKNTLQNESSLKNLLVTIKDMTITPSRVDGRTGASPVSTRARDNWDVRMTLEFYIRGASRDHIATLDATLSTVLDKSGRAGSLITEGNDLLKLCNNCPEATQIKDIITLLGNARAAYDSIILQEKNPKNKFSPIEILEHRTGLMTTIETLEKKL
jgi:ethanolamine utilization microcompartment shell protein EutS